VKIQLNKNRLISILFDVTTRGSLQSSGGPKLSSREGKRYPSLGQGLLKKLN
jgi:hypothetical protein